jgi:hypothetical protein
MSLLSTVAELRPGIQQSKIKSSSGVGLGESTPTGFSLWPSAAQPSLSFLPITAGHLSNYPVCNVTSAYEIASIYMSYSGLFLQYAEW